MQLNDRLIGALAICGGVAIIVGTLGFRELPGQQFGSAFFPRIVGTALILTGAVMLAMRADGPWLRLPALLRGAAKWQVTAALASVIGWVVVSPYLGFIATTTLMIWILILVAGGRLVPAALTALVMACLLYLVFGILLRVPLPFGAIERFLT
ncbi:tripartite tricarboxylate transporter TctB family protein [Dinoroseobacter sp. PD6]|uniref:tripartite tricarboxylate transporter TctB family protein n=1 Tax=Dinoroseobacter sp. PD6 TaxID=3028384 RepID=UPI00237BF0ED|nr:tripartite tricarboxylate transporter TctB family protein [Dinoroseobacter sp. PD6]MDD9716310.1 tripartite tricarboxylate transporter TctB family protein [Dinoroseobacter sp. PD6]